MSRHRKTWLCTPYMWQLKRTRKYSNFYMQMSVFLQRQLNLSLIYHPYLMFDIWSGFPSAMTITRQSKCFGLWHVCCWFLAVVLQPDSSRLNQLLSDQFHFCRYNLCWGSQNVTLALGMKWREDACQLTHSAFGSSSGCKVSSDLNSVSPEQHFS